MKRKDLESVSAHFLRLTKSPDPDPASSTTKVRSDSDEIIEPPLLSPHGGRNATSGGVHVFRGSFALPLDAAQIFRLITRLKSRKAGLPGPGRYQGVSSPSQGDQACWS